MPQSRLYSDIAADCLKNVGGRGFLWIIRGYLFHPGFHVLVDYRVARFFYGLRGLRFFGRILWARGCLNNGCYLSLDARIEPGLSLPHPTGIVIGAGVQVGAGVEIYQNVTLGRKHVEVDRYPRIESGACIYAGAVVNGPITVGTGAVVGANSVVLANVPDGVTVAGIPAKVINKKND